MLRYLLLFFPFLASAQVEVLSYSPRVELIHNFLSDEECDKLIELARPTLKRSTVVDPSTPNGRILDPRRTSEGTFFPRNHPELKSIEKRLTNLAQIPRTNGEPIQILHYNIGGEYQPHFDFFDPKNVGGASFLENGGQRALTIIMYLNTTEEGGETIMPRIHVSVKPKKGNALLFYNCSSPGMVDYQTFHGGAPVIKGEKWIATKWFREGRFQ